ncbi:unnamed protein product [Adineta steineri]|uniref:Uncharacterized protein n=1 Tax=Adineta steineri TaxID=433720 RepID=A0A815NLH3_9BILA|nr:unnamed protein product [Adineta steineri]CAF1627174.1 unnamed protein product [Adineta steineri]
MENKMNGDEQKTDIEDEETIIIICFDPNNEFNDQIEDLKQQINDSVIFYSELELCIHFIKSIEDKTIFLIISPSSISQLNNFNQIKNIFLFDASNNSNEYLSFDDSKLIGIYDKFDLLLSAIKKKINLIQKKMCQCCFFDQIQYENKDLSKQANSFLWHQLFPDVLLHLSSDRQFENVDQSILEQFPWINDYKPNEAVGLFMKYPSLRELINKALKNEDIKQLYMLRYFLSDLIQNLQFGKENRIVYRRMFISRSEFNQIQEHNGKLIMMKEFLTANTDRSSCHVSSTKQISVLFEIELNKNSIFADLELANQETVLLDLNSTFRIDNIQQNDQLWIIKLISVNDGQIIKQKYIDDTRRQFQDLSISIIFGKLICDMSQWNQSQAYFEYLLSNYSHTEDLAWIEHGLGQAYHWKGEWNQSRIYYDHSYERMMKNEPVRIKDSAVILSGIGEILYLQGQMEESYEFHQKALAIRMKYYSPYHPHIAISLYNIGLIFRIRQKQDEALVFFQQALLIQEKYYDSFHVDISTSLTQIAFYLTNEKIYDEVLSCHQRALLIYEKYYPLGHVSVAFTLGCMSSLFYEQDKYNESFTLIQQAMIMQKRFYPNGHIDIASSLLDMGNLEYYRKNYDKSLKMYDQGLLMLRKFNLSNHILAVALLANIGDTQLDEKNDCDKALDYHQQALNILEKYYPSYLARIAIILNSMGRVFYRQRKLDKALDFYHRSINLLKEYYSSDHVETVSFLRNYVNILEYDEFVKRHEQILILRKENGTTRGNACIGSNYNGISHIHRRQNQFDEAFDFAQQSITFTEKSNPTDYTRIADNLSNISEALMYQNKFDEAFDFEQKALNILKIHCPTKIIKIIESLNQMGNLQRKQGKNNEAHHLFQEVLTIYEKNSLSLEADIPFALMSLGRIKYKERNFDESLNYYYRAANVLKEVFCTDYRRITDSLYWVGRNYYKKQCYDRAIEFYEQCLRIEEANSIPKQLTIGKFLEDLSDIKQIQLQYESSLAYELNCLLMREKVLPPNHQDVGENLSNIGLCYEHINQRKLALDYYKRALFIYEQCLLATDDRWTLELKIEELSTEINQFNI